MRPRYVILTQSQYNPSVFYILQRRDADGYFSTLMGDVRRHGYTRFLQHTVHRSASLARKRLAVLRRLCPDGGPCYAVDLNTFRVLK